MDHLVDSNATGQGAALVDFLRSSPDAIVQLVQGLKAASGMPQFDPAQAAASGLLNQVAAPAAAEASMQAFSGTAAGAAMPASSMQATAGLQQQASAVLLGHLDLLQLASLGQGTPLGDSTSSQQQAVAGKAGTAQAAAQLKDMLVTLLNQQAAQTPLQQPQPQSGQPPAQPQAADLCWGAPSPHSNNSTTVPQHTMLPAPGVHELHAQRLQDGVIQHLQSSLLDVLRSTVPQQQLQAAGPAPAPQHSQAPAPVAQACVAPPGMPAQLSAAALAAALGIVLPQDQVSTLGNGAAAAPAPVAQQPAAVVPNYHPCAANGVAAQQQREQAQPQQQQQQAGSSMPHLLDRLRAAVISSTAPDGGSNCTPEQQRLLGMVDQLQSAWAQIGKGAGAGSDDAAARAAMAGPHDAVAAAAAAVEANADADGMPDASGLYMLLEAVQQQVADAAAASGSGRDAAGSAAECGDTNMLQGNGYDAMNGSMYAAMNGQHAEAGWGDGYADTSMGYGRAGGYAPQQQQGGSSRRKRSRAAEQQQQLAAGVGGLAGMLAAVMQQEGMRAEDAVDPTVEQKWLLKPRARGKRQVKPNKVALTGELPPVADRWAGKARRSAGAGGAAPGAASSEEDELWKPPRVRATSKRRRTQGGSEDGAGASDKDSQDQQQQGSAGAGRAKGAAAAGRRGYGWQLLQQQQQPDEAHSPLGAHPEAAEAAAEGADAITEDAGGSYSDSGADDADDDGAAGYVTGDGGSADGGSEGGVAAASASAATGAKPRVKASRRDRWVPPTEEWTSDDGLKVWPKDTQICAGARVFYVAYKWVEDYWPNNLDTPDNHITAHPIRFYLDGHDTEVELTAKLRLYRKAVHLVISPYSALAKKFVRKWLAGYAFDPDKQVLRAYLSTLKPKPPKLQVEEPDPEQLTAAAAAAAEWCNTAAAQFAAGPVAVDAQQHLAAQLAALASLLQPKVKTGKDSKRGPAAAAAAAAAVQLPTKLPQLPGVTQDAEEQPQADPQQQQQVAQSLPMALQATMSQLQQPAAMPLAAQNSATPQALATQQLQGQQAAPAHSQQQGAEEPMQAM